MNKRQLKELFGLDFIAFNEHSSYAVFEYTLEDISIQYYKYQNLFVFIASGHYMKTDNIKDVKQFIKNNITFKNFI